MQLTLTEYEQAELMAIASLPNRAVEAFQPTHFNRVGYPTRISELAEIVKYAEVMHEGETASHMKTLVGLSDHEWKSLTSITGDVWTLTSSLGCPTLPRASLLRAFHVLRRIQRIYRGGRPRVFELGPGTGYLGALLSALGYPYAAMDISEGFYLYQHACWNVTAPYGVDELALALECQPEMLRSPTPGKPVHVPWWHFASLTPTGGNLQDSFDLVICNRALCEMNAVALQFALRIGRAFLSGESSVPKAFLFDGWGSDVVSKPIQVLLAFLRAGYAPAYVDDTFNTSVFVPWRFDDRFDGRAMSEAMDLIRFGRGNDESAVIRRVFDKAMPNRMSAVLAAGEDDASETRPFRGPELEAFWRELSGCSNHRNRDEIFWDTASFPSFLADALPQGRELYLFGSGSLGQRVCRCLDDLGRPARAFLDNDRSKWGQCVAGLPIQDPGQIPSGGAVLVTTAFWREVVAQLTRAGLVEGSDFFVFPESFERIQ